MRDEKRTYRFTLRDRCGDKALIQLMDLALKETQLVFGKAKFKLEAGVRANPKKAQVLIEGDTECGEYLAKLFAGFLIKKFGEEAFVVDRIQA